MTTTLLDFKDIFTSPPSIPDKETVIYQGKELEVDGDLHISLKLLKQLLMQYFSNEALYLKLDNNFIMIQARDHVGIITKAPKLSCCSFGNQVGKFEIIINPSNIMTWLAHKLEDNRYANRYCHLILAGDKLFLKLTTRLRFTIMTHPAANISDLQVTRDINNIMTTAAKPKSMVSLKPNIFVQYLKDIKLATLKRKICEVSIDINDGFVTFFTKDNDIELSPIPCSGPSDQRRAKFDVLDIITALKHPLSKSISIALLPEMVIKSQQGMIEQIVIVKPIIKRKRI